MLQRYIKKVKIPKFPLINFKKKLSFKEKYENRRGNDNIKRIEH